MKPLAVYDFKTKKRLAYLQNAYDIEYQKQTNSVWSASFSLPYSDDKKIYCNAFNYVEIWDKGNNEDIYIGLFRIISVIETKNAGESNVSTIRYTLEHVMSSLLESSIVGYKELGGAGKENTRAVITKILSYQNTTKWVLGECDYTKEFKYEFEDMNLLSALYYVVSALPEDYYWAFDTQIFPWRINLKKVSITPIADIRYKKNMTGITKKIDSNSVCTRLYLYGNLLEDNTKINISSVNPTGKEYLDSNSGIAEYGIITTIINDSRFETPQSLYDYGVALLKKLDRPFITYEVDIRAIYNAANLKIGDLVRVVSIDEEVDEKLIVQQISKDNLTGNPESGKIIIGQGTINIGTIIKGFI